MEILFLSFQRILYKLDDLHHRLQSHRNVEEDWIPDGAGRTERPVTWAAMSRLNTGRKRVVTLPHACRQ